MRTAGSAGLRRVFRVVLDDGRSPYARSQRTAGQIDYYSRAMKAPRIHREAAARLADQAPDNGWTHEEYLAAALSREGAAKQASGAEARAWAAGFPARKSLEDFSFDTSPASNCHR